MSATAAHLVDHVLPRRVPVRQWVLSLPRWLRYVLPYDAERTSAVLRCGAAPRGSDGRSARSPPPLVRADVTEKALFVLDRAGHLERYEVEGR